MSGLFKKRRALLMEKVRHPIVLFAGFENPSSRFVQDSTFFYFTGIEEPGVACVLLPDGDRVLSVLYVPTFEKSRVQWMGAVLEPSKQAAELYGFDEACPLGDSCSGYTVDFFGSPFQWRKMVNDLLSLVGKGHAIGVVKNNLLSYRITAGAVALAEASVDISPFIADLRRTKDTEEVAALFKAGDITIMAQEAAAMAIDVGATEAKVRASIDYVFAQEGAVAAFPSIVASGKNSTILHYDKCSEAVAAGKGDLVLVDIGARFDHYCADVTRTYPVSGKFSRRQREVYNVVLKAQEAAIELAKPGVFLRNDADPSKSLYHCVLEVLRSGGLAEYFTHGVGHFLGLDVHDVGQTLEPLRPGDVITLEPGVYLPDEGFGVRIEDDFWIIEDGIICLTEHLPKASEEIESFFADLKK